MSVELHVRKTPKDVWIRNFSNSGWRVRTPANNGWVLMTPQNTKVRNADNTAWLTTRQLC